MRVSRILIASYSSRGGPPRPFTPVVFANDPVNLLHLNDGSGFFSDATGARMPPSSIVTRLAVALADVEGDGDLDIVVGDGLYLNDGFGYYVDATAERLPRYQVSGSDTPAVAVGDVDGDGDLDILFGDWGQNRLYLNLLRQLDTPFLARVGGPYTIEAYARYGPAALVDLALPLLSTGTASIPVPPFGVFGLDPARTVALSPLIIPRPAGVGSINLAVPNDPALAGVSLHAQALLVPYPRTGQLTNVTTDVVIK